MVFFSRRGSKGRRRKPSDSAPNVQVVTEGTQPGAATTGDNTEELAYSDPVKHTQLRDVATYKNFFFSQSPFHKDIVPRPVIEELIYHISEDLKARAITTPYLLLSFREQTDNKQIRNFIDSVFVRHQRPLTGDALLRIIRMQDPYTLAGALKWCWCRIPGGIISWKAYNKFKAEEEMLGKSIPYDSFFQIFPRCVESDSHMRLVVYFLELIMALATHGRANGMGETKLPRLAGIWAFDVIIPDNSEPTSVADGLAAWSLAAEASNHIFFSYLRWLASAPQVTISAPLMHLLNNQGEAYPPPPAVEYYGKGRHKLLHVPMVRLMVGKLSANPMVLLRRASHVLRFNDPSNFHSEDDFNTLYMLFNDPDLIEQRLTPQSKLVLDCISRDNDLFSDHPVLIKDTYKMTYDLRARTWSKFYNHAFINPSTGEVRQPLENYVYDRSQMFDVQNASVPSQERDSSLPYPRSPRLDAFDLEAEEQQSKIRQSVNWDSFAQYGFDAKEHALYRQNIRDEAVEAQVSRVAIDDFFVWVWMCRQSEDQTEAGKATFGRSIIVEIMLDDRTKRWVVVEELLIPPPPPVKKPTVGNTPVEREHSAKKRSVSTPVPPSSQKKSGKRRKPAARKPVGGHPQKATQTPKYVDQGVQANMEKDLPDEPPDRPKESNEPIYRGFEIPPPPPPKEDDLEAAAAGVELTTSSRDRFVTPSPTKSAQSNQGHQGHLRSMSSDDDDKTVYFTPKLSDASEVYASPSQASESLNRSLNKEQEKQEPQEQPELTKQTTDSSTPGFTPASLTTDYASSDVIDNYYQDSDSNDDDDDDLVHNLSALGISSRSFSNSTVTKPGDSPLGISIVGGPRDGHRSVTMPSILQQKPLPNAAAPSNRSTTRSSEAFAETPPAQFPRYVNSSSEASDIDAPLPIHSQKPPPFLQVSDQSDFAHGLEEIAPGWKQDKEESPSRQVSVESAKPKISVKRKPVGSAPTPNMPSSAYSSPNPSNNPNNSGASVKSPYEQHSPSFSQAHDTSQIGRRQANTPSQAYGGFEASMGMSQQSFDGNLSNPAPIAGYTRPRSRTLESTGSDRPRQVQPRPLSFDRDPSFSQQQNLYPISAGRVQQRNPQYRMSGSHLPPMHGSQGNMLNSPSMPMVRPGGVRHFSPSGQAISSSNSMASMGSGVPAGYRPRQFLAPRGDPGYSPSSLSARDNSSVAGAASLPPYGPAFNESPSRPRSNMVGMKGGFSAGGEGLRSRAFDDFDQPYAFSPERNARLSNSSSLGSIRPTTSALPDSIPVAKPRYRHGPSSLGIVQPNRLPGPNSSFQGIVGPYPMPRGSHSRPPSRRGSEASLLFPGGGAYPGLEESGRRARSQSPVSIRGMHRQDAGRSASPSPRKRQDPPYMGHDQQMQRHGYSESMSSPVAAKQGGYPATVQSIGEAHAGPLPRWSDSSSYQSAGSNWGKKPLPIDPKWKDVKTNLQAMKEQRRDTSLPVVVDRRQNPDIGHEVVDNYLNQAYKSVKNPSIRTGSHVRVLEVKDSQGVGNSEPDFDGTDFVQSRQRENFVNSTVAQSTPPTQKVEVQQQPPQDEYKLPLSPLYDAIERGQYKPFSGPVKNATPLENASNPRPETPNAPNGYSGYFDLPRPAPASASPSKKKDSDSKFTGVVQTNLMGGSPGTSKNHRVSQEPEVSKYSLVGLMSAAKRRK